MSARWKWLAAALLLAVGALAWEARWQTGPPAPITDPLLVLSAAAALAWPLRRSAAAPLAVGLALGAFALYAPPQRPAADSPSPPGARDRVLITVDTLRADHLWDLGPQWRVYEQAVAPSSWTLPSMTSLMTGTPVRRHRGGLPVDGSWSSPQAMPWLAERVDGRKAAFVCNPYLRAEFGFDRGFDRFEHADGWRETFSVMHALRQWRKRALGGVERQRHERDAHLVAQAIAWWESNPPGRFLWLHLLLPHEYARDPHKGGEGAEAYAGNVRQVRELLDPLLDAIDEDALVVLTSDHGEALGEGGRHGHGLSFDEEQVLVPLAVRGVAPGRVARQVSLTDVAGLLADGDLATLDAGRGTVELGGLFREAAWSARTEGGGRIERDGPLADPGPALSPELRDALEELGYVAP